MLTFEFLKCREQLQKEVQHLKDGVKALFNAMQKPVMDVHHLRSEHEQTRELVENIDKFKGEVTKSLSQLTVKCNTLDQHVPELREKLEQAIHTINVCIDLFRLIYMMALSASHKFLVGCHLVLLDASCPGFMNRKAVCWGRLSCPSPQECRKLCFLSQPVQSTQVPCFTNPRLLLL